MSNELAKRWLCQYRPIKSRIRIIDRMIEKGLIEDGVAGISYDGISTSKTYKFSSVVEDQLIRSEEKLHKLQKEKEILKGVVDTVDIAVEGLTIDQQRVIKLYYMNEERMTIWQIGNVIGYSTSHIKNELLPKGLRTINKELKGYRESIENWT